MGDFTVLYYHFGLVNYHHLKPTCTNLTITVLQTKRYVDLISPLSAQNEKFPEPSTIMLKTMPTFTIIDKCINIPVQGRSKARDCYKHYIAQKLGRVLRT